MILSVLISFRNRDKDRVVRCLTALNNQSFKDFEVIFVDYGSEGRLAEELEEIVSGFSFAKYLYNVTRGMPWNQPHALNTGLVRAIGDYIIRLDVDLIIPPYFFEKLVPRLSPESYIHSQAFYLTQDFKSYDKLFSDKSTQEGLLISDKIVLGLLMVVDRAFFLNINGFDEFYTYWGFDDLDMSKRIQAAGRKIEWLDIKEFPVFHQWHSPSSLKNLTGWYDVLKEYYQNTSNEKIADREIGKLYKKEDRKALLAYLNEDYQSSEEIRYSFPKANFFASLGKHLVIDAEKKLFHVNYISQLDNKNKTGRLTDVVEKVNKFISLTKVSYRLTDIQTYSTEYLDVNEVRDYLFYFIVNMRAMIEDYFFEYNDREVVLIVAKK